VDTLGEIECATITQWSSWLEQHHTQDLGVWVIYHKKSSPQSSLDYEDLVCEALCWGWVDSRIARVDEHRTKMYFSPRRRTSTWSPSNRERVERLESEGRMQPSGRAVVVEAKRAGKWK
jgi:uncharacterized protein YdeI (YjbR/CyaY-like superfamily)